MKRALLLGGAVTVMLGAAPVVTLAEDAVPANPMPVQMAQAENQAGEIDAGSLIGQEVVDANGNKIGDIDSVMVDQNGQVASVVVDVSDWLETEKLIALNWSDLQIGEDNRIVTSMTKESAEQAETYAYQDESLRGQVMTETGERYAAGDTPRPVGEETTAGTTTAPAAGDQTAATEPTADDSAVVNADGSLNASKLIGLDVQSPEDEKVGDIGEVVLDQDGQVQGVVVDVGGFLGIGSRPVLLDWKDVNLASQDGRDRAVVNLSKDRLEQMPAYESSAR